MAWLRPGLVGAAYRRILFAGKKQAVEQFATAQVAAATFDTMQAIALILLGVMGLCSQDPGSKEARSASVRTLHPGAFCMWPANAPRTGIRRLAQPSIVYDRIFFAGDSRRAPMGTGLCPASAPPAPWPKGAPCKSQR